MPEEDIDKVYGGVLSLSERKIRKQVVKALTEKGFVAEATFFGIMVYQDNKGYKLVLREDY